MPNQSKRLPAYRLHKPSGQARVIIRGEHRYLGKFNSPESLEKYGRLVAELAATPESAPLSGQPEEGNILVVQLCAAYWEWAQTYYRKGGQPTSQLDNLRRVLALLRGLYSHSPVTKFGPLALRAIQKRLVTEKKARHTVNDVCQAIRRIFKWGASQELVPVTVYQALATVPGLRKGRTEAREPEPVCPISDHVVDGTIPHLPQVVADMVRLQRFSGCRPGEVCRIRPCDVDRSSDVWLYRVPGHKTEHLGRERVVCIGPKGQGVLRPYLLRAADAYCFSPAESEAKRRAQMRATRKTNVQPSQRNRRKTSRRKFSNHYVKDTYRRAIVRAVDLANRQRTREARTKGIEPELLPHWRPNQLRHSKATEVRTLFGLEGAQVTLGHAHARVTEVYAERDTKLAADIARKIG